MEALGLGSFIFSQEGFLGNTTRFEERSCWPEPGPHAAAWSRVRYVGSLDLDIDIGCCLKGPEGLWDIDIDVEVDVDRYFGC